MPFDINVDDTPPPITLFSSGAQLKLNRKTIEMSAVRSTSGRSQAFVVTNVGGKAFTLDADSFILGGDDAAQFAIVGGSIPRRISVGKRAQFFLALRPASNAPTTRVLTAFLDIKPVGETSALARVSLRGVATTGEGGDKEPSLARLMELFQYSINVGDTSPNTTFLDINGNPTDEILAPRFQRSSTAPVTITPIAQFVTKTTTVAGRIGIYTPGLPSSRKTLFELSGADGQTVSPVPNGATTFNPGDQPFSVWAEASTFIDNGTARIVYGEDALNTWETNADARRKVRVYNLVEKGAPVPNAYVVTFEEYPPQNDQNDYIFVLSNVTLASSRPVLGLVSIDGIEDPTTLAFNRIEFENQSIGNDVHDVSRIRITNTGNKDLFIYSLSLAGEDAGSFQLINPPSGTTTIARGASLDVTVKFIATGGDLNQATLNIQSNDKIRRVTSVNLNGFWQSHSEANEQGVSQEPSLAEVFATFGFRTVAVADGQDINTFGAPTPVGDEVLSAYWKSADVAKPVYIKQLAGFHQQGTTGDLAWYEQGKPYFSASDSRYPGPSLNGPRNTLFFSNINDGQSFYQRKKDTTDPAWATFKTSTTFGFRLDGEFSDDSLNLQGNADAGAHHMRFYPVRDSSGNFVANTYIMTMDYSSINFDYNDNIFLVSNIRPADRTGAVEGLAGYEQRGSIVLDWAATTGAASYMVLRSNKADGSFKSVTSSPISDSFFTDVTATPGRSWYYRVIALDAQGDKGMAANTRVFLGT